jgi:hypothetical protein
MWLDGAPTAVPELRPATVTKFRNQHFRGPGPGPEVTGPQLRGPDPGPENSDPKLREPDPALKFRVRNFGDPARSPKFRIQHFREPGLAPKLWVRNFGNRARPPRLRIQDFRGPGPGPDASRPRSFESNTFGAGSRPQTSGSETSQTEPGRRSFGTNTFGGPGPAPEVTDPKLRGPRNFGSKTFEGPGPGVEVTDPKFWGPVPGPEISDPKLSGAGSGLLSSGSKTWGGRARASELVWNRMAVIRKSWYATQCCAILLPGRRSGFRDGFRPDSNRGCLTIGPPAGLRPTGVLTLRLSLLESGRNPARNPDFWPGSTIA